VKTEYFVHKGNKFVKQQIMLYDKKTSKHWNKCVLFPNSNSNFLAGNPEQAWKEHALQLLYMSQQQNYQQ
jgi:hypothetical protein